MPPENLLDEVTRMRERRPKITFEDVNMNKRTVDVSMNGPWGQNGNLIHFEAKVSFPENYPNAEPDFKLGSSSFMSSEIDDKLWREVQQMAAEFVSRKQGCLEAALCYLLGEVDLESSTTSLKDVSMKPSETDLSRVIDENQDGSGSALDKTVDSSARRKDRENLAMNIRSGSNTLMSVSKFRDPLKRM
jgi:hypothetical protein